MFEKALCLNFFIFYGHSSSDIFTQISSLRKGYIEPNVGICESLFNKYDVDKTVGISLEIDDSIIFCNTLVPHLFMSPLTALSCIREDQKTWVNQNRLLCSRWSDKDYQCTSSRRS